MPISITNGEYEQFVHEDEARQLTTFVPIGGDILIAPETDAVERADGFLIQDGNYVSGWNPEGETWYAYADGADVELYVTHRFHFGRDPADAASGGID